MALTTADVDAVRAQWDEWVAEPFRLDLEVESAPPVVDLSFNVGDRMDVRVSAPDKRVRVRVWHQTIDAFDPPRVEHETLVFDEPCPYDAEALRASVTVLARTIAARMEGDERP